MTTRIEQLDSALKDRYRIERELGAGGMATVYLARDLKHNRNVALKVLNSDIGAALGAERFLAEIGVTATLQHPHLLPLFDSGDASGLLFYVMPFVDGETLRARLEREDQLPVHEAVRIASAIANALEYAHARGVIHRDLKPENILLQGGQPVIADFGIALAVSNASDARLTLTGMSVGTPQYMSPEQAAGEKKIDARSDIFALGAVTYEMLVGDPPHTGRTAQAVIAKVLGERPGGVRAARPSVPEHVAYAVEKALEKLPADRWRTAAEFDAALTGRMNVVPEHTPRASVPTLSSTVARVLSRPLVAAACAALAVASAASWWILTHQPAPAHAVRFALENPPGARIAASGDALAMSPDGRVIAFVGAFPDGKRQLFLRALDDLTPRAIAGTDGATMPFFSPDGHWVGFIAGARIQKVPVSGGGVVPLADVRSARGASWGRNGEIAVSTGFVSENGGAIRLLPGADTSRFGLGFPLILASGETVLTTSWSGQAVDARIIAVSARTGVRTDLGLLGVCAIGIVDGFLVYVSAGGALLAVRFDEHALHVTGEPQQLVEGISAGGASDRPAVALSAGGTLIYQVGASIREMLIGDTHGGTHALTTDQRAFDNPRYSPDGKWAAFEITERSGVQIWLYNLATNAWAQLTTVGTANTRPEWTWDSKRVLYRSNRDGAAALWWQPVDGSSAPELLVRSAGKDVYEGVISPDGETVLFRTGAGGPADIWYRRITGDTATRAFAATAFVEQDPRFSPDGKFVAYASSELGGHQVIVRQFPSGAGRTQVSTDGGYDPVWSRDGKRLYYARRAGASIQLIAAHVSLTPVFGIVGRDTVIQGAYHAPDGHAAFDVAPDGEHLLLIRAISSDVSTIVVTGWLDEWRAQRAAAKKR